MVVGVCLEVIVELVWRTFVGLEVVAVAVCLLVTDVYLEVVIDVCLEVIVELGCGAVVSLEVVVELGCGTVVSLEVCVMAVGLEMMGELGGKKGIVEL
jgi:hypothetical protein